MKRVALLSLVAVTLAACSERSVTSPAMDGPSLLVSPGTYSGTLDESNAPGGTHLQRGTISCTVNSDLSVDCSGYQLNGVGHTNAEVSLVANYTAIINCYNPGRNRNNPIESHEGTFSDEDTFTATASRNGRLNVGAATADSDAAPIGCPNPNWRPVVREGSLQLVSFTYSVTFDGFSSPAIFISES